jgi:CTD kinase subunit gamma
MFIYGDCFSQNSNLEQTNMNTRANIMYFLEHFLDMCRREGHDDYIYMIQRDIFGIVDAVAPDDGTGAANVKVARTVSFSFSISKTSRF